MKLNLDKVLIGTDFELFIVSDAGKFISAVPLIEGTKHEPLPVGDKVGNMIQHDGALAEGGVPPVDITGRDEMWGNIQFVLESMQEKLPKNLKLVCCTNGEFEDEELADPEAREAGCTADYCAWNGGDINDAPNFGVTNNRCAGGHIHITHPGLSVKEGMRLIRLLDVFLALPLLFIDEDRSRRALYGKAGCFRYKDYGNATGVEYRTLSNIWIKNKEIYDFVWDALQRALKAFNEGVEYQNYQDRIESAINGYNLPDAERLCDEFGVVRLQQAELA